MEKNYFVSYNSTTLNPNWVAYELTANETEGPWSRKGLRFMPDPDCDEEQADNFCNLPDKEEVEVESKVVREDWGL